MAVIANRDLTLGDLARALGPDRMGVASVIEILSKATPELDHIVMVEGNLDNGHQFGVRRYLAEGTWRRLYQGVQPTKSGVDQVVVNMANLVAYSRLDADLPGDKAGLRSQSIAGIMQGMSHQLATALWYGDNSTDPAQFNGLSWHYNSKSAESGQNIVDGGGTGSDNRSIWLIGWGDDKIHGIYPKDGTGPQLPTNKAFGIAHEDLGRQHSQTVGDKAGQGLIEYLVDRMSAKVGLCVEDWRCAVRIANVDRSDLKRDHSSGAYIEDLVVQATHKYGGALPKDGIRGYMDRNTYSFLHRQRIFDTKDTRMFNNTTGVRSPSGVLALDIGGIPFFASDSLNVDEARVT